MTQPVNTQTASYALKLTDAGGIVEMNCPSANTVTIPLNSAVNFPYGPTNATMLIIAQIGVGQTSIVPAAGVNLRTWGQPNVAGLSATGTLYQRAINDWVWCG